MVHVKEETLIGREIEADSMTPTAFERKDIWEKHQTVLGAPIKTSGTLFVENNERSANVSCDLIEWEEVIDKDRADKLLGTSKSNRRLNKAHMKRLETDIINDRFLGWAFGEPIQVSGNWHDDNYHLMNGHHRLEAIKDSGISVKLKFKYGIPYPLISLMDQVRSRSANDNLKMRGIGDVDNKASTLKLLGKLFVAEDFGSTVGKRISAPHTYMLMYDLLEDEIENAHLKAKKYSSLLRGSSVGTTTMMIMLFDRLAKNHSLLEGFLEGPPESSRISTNDYWGTLLNKRCCSNKTIEEQLEVSCKHPLHKLADRIASRDAEGIDATERKDWHAVWMYEGWLLYTKGITESKQDNYKVRKIKDKTSRVPKYLAPKRVKDIWTDVCHDTRQLFPDIEVLAISLVSGE